MEPGNSLGKQQNLLERLKMECDMMDFKEFDGHGRRWMELAHDCVQWLACSLALSNFWFYLHVRYVHYMLKYIV